MTRYLIKHRWQLLAGLAFTLLFAWLQAGSQTGAIPFLNRLDLLAYDQRLNLVPPQLDEASRVVILDVDEQSLKIEGRWPWSRQKIADLVARTRAAGARVIGFDVAFSEPERNIAEELATLVGEAQGSQDELAYLSGLQPMADRDAMLAETVAGGDVVLGFIFQAAAPNSVGRLPSPWAFLPPEQAAVTTLPNMPGFTGNLDTLQKAARHAGFVNTTTDIDGVLRTTPLVLRRDNLVYPSLSLAMARRYLDGRRFKLESTQVGENEVLTGLRLEDLAIRTDIYGRVLIPYLGPRYSLPYVSATRVLQAEDPVAMTELRDRAVIVGTSALGLGDVISSPTDPALPGVEVHATVLQHLVTGATFPNVPEWASGAQVLAIIALGLFLTALCPSLGALSITVVTLSALAAVIAANFWLWGAHQIALSPVLPVLTVLAIVTLNVIYGYFTEAQQKRQVRKAFSSYMAPALVDQLVEDPTGLRLKGETREMTFLFSDIAGFTSFTERVGPEVLVETLNDYLDAMCQEVMDHGGTIDKIVGDAVVAIFNAPLDQPDHAARAVRCALGMDKISQGFRNRMKKRDLPFGFTRVGVNTGDAIVGNFGGSSRFDYTAHGDPINTAARMESVNKHLGTKVCISGSTVAQCPDHHFRPVGGLVLKGKTEAIDAFEPITAEEDASPFMARYRQAFDALTAGSDAAITAFRALREEFPDDPLVKLHYERIEQGLLTTTIVLAEK